MGVETSIPPFVIDTAAPKGVPRRPQLPDFLETILAPPCPARGPEAGSAHINDKYFTDIHGSGVNRMGSCPFHQSKFFTFFTTDSVLTSGFFAPQKVHQNRKDEKKPQDCPICDGFVKTMVPVIDNQINNPIDNHEPEFCTFNAVTKKVIVVLR